MAVIGLLAFDLVDRHFGKSLWLPVFAAVGGGIGYAVQAAISRAHWSAAAHAILVHTQGDDIHFDRDLLMANWPVLFLKESDYVGLAVGLIAGIGGLLRVVWQIPTRLVALVAPGPGLVRRLLALARLVRRANDAPSRR